MLGYACVRGKESADRLDGVAIVGIGRAMDRPDIVNVPRQAGREKGASNDCDSTSLSRLQEYHMGKKEKGWRLVKSTIQTVREDW